MTINRYHCYEASVARRHVLFRGRLTDNGGGNGVDEVNATVLIGQLAMTLIVI